MPYISSIRGIHNNPKEIRDAQPKNSDIFEVTGGDKVYTAGGYTIHMFTEVGEHNLNVKLKPGIKQEEAMHLLGATLSGVEHLTVAGGGSGGSRHSGGGGAGGMIISGTNLLNTGSFGIGVGGGGGGIQGDSPGRSGQNSNFDSAQALGGGGGGTWGQAGERAGGSGGGSGGPGGGRAGGGAQQPSSTPYSGVGYGNRGGIMHYPPGPIWAGGGGGAGARGGDGSNNQGGAGRASSINGTSYFWAGGGGGGVWSGVSGGQGGSGGGAGGAVGPEPPDPVLIPCPFADP